MSSKKLESINFYENPTNSNHLLGELLDDDDTFLKSKVIVHCHDGSNPYADLLFDRKDGLLANFLNRLIETTSKDIEDGIFYDLHARGCLCTPNKMIDLLGFFRKCDSLPRDIHSNFNTWIDPFMPNYFNLLIDGFEDAKSILKLFKKAARGTMEKLSSDVQNAPRIVVVDVVRINDYLKDSLKVGRWIFADIPCGNNAKVGNDLIKFLIQDPVSRVEVVSKVQSEPLAACIKNFLLKDTTVAFITSSTDVTWSKEFKAVVGALKKWNICTGGTTLLDRARYRNGSNEVRKFMDSIRATFNSLYAIPADVKKLNDSEIDHLKCEDDRLVKGLEKTRLLLKSKKEEQDSLAKSTKHTSCLADDLSMKSLAIQNVVLQMEEETEKLQNDIKLIEDETMCINENTSQLNEKISKLKAVNDKLKESNNRMVQYLENSFKDFKARESEYYMLDEESKEIIEDLSEQIQDIEKGFKDIELEAKTASQDFEEAVNTSDLEECMEKIKENYGDFMKLPGDIDKDVLNMVTTTVNYISELNENSRIHYDDLMEKIKNLPAVYKKDIQGHTEDKFGAIKDFLQDGLKSIQDKREEYFKMFNQLYPSL
uniref:TIR domain-containing protein n=1 Tax=Parastrongyloides trichosuri TaxID=131310 RepID=A0A0N4ZH70_PARTI